MSRRSRQCGFTLFETIVAFAITSGTLALLYQIHAQATYTISLASDYGHVTELAQSLLAETMPTTENARIDRSGVADGRFRWQARTEPLDLSSGAEMNASSAPASDFALSHVTVEVSWGTAERERTFTLETVKPVVPVDGQLDP